MKSESEQILEAARLLEAKDARIRELEAERDHYKRTTHAACVDREYHEIYAQEAVKSEIESCRGSRKQLDQERARVLRLTAALERRTSADGSKGVYNAHEYAKAQAECSAALADLDLAPVLDLLRVLREPGGHEAEPGTECAWCGRLATSYCCWEARVLHAAERAGLRQPAQSSATKENP